MAVPEKPTLRLLIDACLTPAAIPELEARFGSEVDVVHVDAVSPPAATDDAVFAWAATTMRAVVTANIGDFTQIARRTSGHAGLVLVDDQDTRNVQIGAILRITAALLARAEISGDPKGHVFTWRKTGGGRLVARKLP